MEDDAWKKLPLQDRCIHKLWKARVNGYEEAANLFKQIDDEKSSEFAKYLGLIKNFVTDSNVVAQEKGLEATLAFVENYALAGKTVGEVMSGIITKCFSSPKAKIKETAAAIVLMYIEIEKHDKVVEDLVKGLEQKNPKIVIYCVTVLTEALNKFGSKIINVKPMIKKINSLFGDRDQNVRLEARAMVIELYRWIGPAIKSQLGGIQPVQISELEVEFAKVAGQKMTPTRFIRSDKEKQAKLTVEEDNEVQEDDEAGCEEQLDAYDLAEPVDVLGKLPKNFYELIESKKWTERKEGLEALDILLKAPRFENGDYGNLIRALKKIVQKDNNIVVIVLAGKSLTNLANGLQKNFRQYASFCIPGLLEKFKEKKQNVVATIREALDAIYPSVNLELIVEDVLEALKNKNPSVKTETALFLCRAFTNTQPSTINKKLLKAYTGALVKNINESDPGVRDSSCEGIATLMKLVGAKTIAPFIVELEKDDLKMAKVKEFYEKIVIIVKKGKAEPTKAKVSAEPEKPALVKKSVKPSTSTGSTITKKKSTLSTVSSASVTIVKSKSSKTIVEKAQEREITEEEAMEIVGELIKPDIITGLADTNWKTRLTTMAEFTSQVQEINATDLPTQALVRILIKKPGLKDANFQVLKARLDAIQYLAENSSFSTTTANLCINGIVEKLGDGKNGASASEVLLSISEATKFNFVATLIMDYAFTQKSLKVLEEALIWLSNSIKEFGFSNLNAKSIIENSKKALASSNSSVRTAAISLIGTLYLYLGPSLYAFFENEKPALREQINAEIEKYENVIAPIPTRGPLSSASSLNILDQDDEKGTLPHSETTLTNLLPRIDISAEITEAFIEKLSDKNWKVRNEALVQVINIINEAKLIKPNIGDLPQVLALRLVDSKRAIAQTALNVCQSIATAMGAPCRQYVRVLLPGFIKCLGDSKTWIRSAAISCMNSWGDLCSYKEFFEGQIIADAFKDNSYTLRSELWLWLAEKLPKIKRVPKEEIVACIPHLYANLEDRNEDVRKNAQEAVLGMMIHASYEEMFKQTDKVKPASKNVVKAALDKARCSLPTKPLPKQKQALVEENIVRGTKPVAPSKTAAKPKGAPDAANPVSARKKEEDIESPHALAVNHLKDQRTINETKFKVLKWNFTTPRQEYVDLLKEQMLSANVDKTLISNMFHTDFNYHLKAIDSLMADLPTNISAIISNLDLVLKWLTLRFFDTNPTVLLKSLDYLHSVFDMLSQVKYQMLENEGAAFIPYLVLKIGDPKDAIRSSVRSLLKQLASIFSITKLFTYLMEGLKSKNARQRTACLDLMGSFIEDYGISICFPTPNACLKEVSKQISDRDHAVRNAALNCILQAYFIIGEKVFKMLGQISEKDTSLLEERIKRAKSSNRLTRSELPKTNIAPQCTTTVLPMQQVEEQNDCMDKDVEDDEIPSVPVITLSTQLPQESVKCSEPFQIDKVDNVKSSVGNIELKKFCLDFLKDDIVIPPLRVTFAPLPKPSLPNETFCRSTLGLAQTSPRVTKDLVLERIISDMGSPNVPTALKAIEKMVGILQSNKESSMVELENEFMSAISAQFNILQTQDPTMNSIVLKIYRALLTVINAFYLNKTLGQKISVDVIKTVLKRLIMVLVEAKLEHCPSGDAYIRIVNLHCVKIIERSNTTNLVCALVKLLSDCIYLREPARLTDLVMKCLWRVIKLIPTWTEEVDYDSILYEVHLFLKHFPTSWWKTQPIDTPLRTIKTILHSSVKRKGDQLLFHLSKIDKKEESELEIYILRLLKSLKLIEIEPLKVEKIEPKKTLSQSDHAMLTDIFKQIGNKNESKEGFKLLFDFLKQHPETDINQFLQKSTHKFHDFINNGLKEIERIQNE